MTKSTTRKKAKALFDEDAVEEALPIGIPEEIFKSAVEHWWCIQVAEEKKKKKAAEAGMKKLPGDGDTEDFFAESAIEESSDGIRSGKSMDGFRKMIIETLINEVGVRKEDIYPKIDEFGAVRKGIASATELPAYFRASKNWDLLICKNSLHKRVSNSKLADAQPQLIAAIEFKSQFGSIGKNQNNRIEEAVGSAADFWESHRAFNFGSLAPKPWLGYLFVGMYEPEHWKDYVAVSQPHFHADPAFVRSRNKKVDLTSVNGWSYARRYQIMMDRLVGRLLYDRACLVTTHRQQVGASPNYHCPFQELSGTTFMDGLRRHVVGYYPDQPISLKRHPNGSHE